MSRLLLLMSLLLLLMPLDGRPLLQPVLMPPLLSLPLLALLQSGFALRPPAGVCRPQQSGRPGAAQRPARARAWC